MKFVFVKIFINYSHNKLIIKGRSSNDSSIVEFLNLLRESDLFSSVLLQSINYSIDGSYKNFIFEVYLS